MGICAFEDIKSAIVDMEEELRQQFKREKIIEGEVDFVLKR